MGEPEHEQGPKVFRMNHVNDKFKTASKHVQMHCAQTTAKPKAKGKASAKSAPKAGARR